MHLEVKMPKGSAELTAARREEIMDACESLYRTMNFKEITLKEIGAVTFFTRTSIYNYFRSKEEIFLALFEREYREWTEELNAITPDSAVTDSDQLASDIADTLSRRELMLRLLTLFEFLHGVYPYAYATPKQKEAMDSVGVAYGEYTLREFAYEGIRRILGSIR